MVSGFWPRPISNGMKICLIHTLYTPYSRGGAEVVVDIVIKELLNQGHEIVLITLGRKDKIEQQGRIKIYRINPFNVFSFLDINSKPVWLRLLWHPIDVFNLSSYFKVKKILAQENPKVVMTHNLKGLGYLIPKAIKQNDVAHIHTVHDVQLSRPSGIILFNQEKPFLILDKVYEKFTRKLFGSPRAVVSPSKWLMEYYSKRGFFYNSQKVILQNPVVFKKVKAVEAGQNDELINLLFVGQIEKFKGILFLINTLKKMPQTNWQLTIVGSGGSEQLVKDLVVSDMRFNFVGRVPNDNLTDYFRQADLTIVPSLCYENSPKVIDESLVANVPVVAADIGGVSEMVQDDYNGFTFAPGNEKSLTDVLQLFLNHPEKIEALKKNCFVSVRNYSVGNYIKKLLSLI